MNKSIVVINTPKNCNRCPFKQSPFSFCLGEYEKEKRCPLKPLPQKKEVKMPNYVNDYEYERGWNECIDEILGEEE